MSGLRAARLSELILVTGGSVYGGNSRDEETFRFYQLSDISSCTGASIWRNSRSLVRDRKDEKGALLPCGRWPQPILLWYCKTNKKQLSSPPSSPPLFTILSWLLPNTILHPISYHCFHNYRLHSPQSSCGALRYMHLCIIRLLDGWNEMKRQTLIMNAILNHRHNFGDQHNHVK